MLEEAGVNTFQKGFDSRIRNVAYTRNQGHLIRYLIKIYKGIHEK